MLADHHQLLALIIRLHQFHHQPGPWLLMLPLLLDGDLDTYRVPDKYRPDKTQPVIPIGHRHLVDYPGREPDGNTEDQGSMRDPLFERLRLTPLFIHMMGKKITGLPGM